MGKPAAFYEGIEMQTKHKDSNISDRSFEDVIDVLEETLRNFEVEEHNNIVTIARAGL